VTRGITNKQCLALNLAAKSRAPPESISLATQSPALNCWSSLDSVHARRRQQPRLNTKRQPLLSCTSLDGRFLPSPVWRSGSTNLHAMIAVFTPTVLAIFHFHGYNERMTCYANPSPLPTASVRSFSSSIESARVCHLPLILTDLVQNPAVDRTPSPTNERAG
jgi:hypothetical protein